MTKKTDTTTAKKKTAKNTATKTVKKKTAKAADSSSAIKKELEKTQSQLHDLQEDNVQLKEKLSKIEEKLEEIPHQRENTARSWDDQVMHGLCRIARAWSDYGPVIIIVLFLLMIVAWISPWDGFFTLCFTLLMVWVFIVSLGMAKSNIKNRFDEALYKVRNK